MLEGTVTSAEGTARKSRLAQLHEERADMARQLKAGLELPRADPGKYVTPSRHVHPHSSLTPCATQDAISTPELVSLHNVNIREQDEMLDTLGDSLVRQRRLGENIGREADESTALLRDLSGRIDHSHARVKEETDSIEKFDVSGGAWGRRRMRWC